MVEREQVSNFEIYKTETDEIHWFLDKEDNNIETTNPRTISKNNTKTIATITAKTEKSHIKKLITSGLRIFMIKGALFKAEDYSDIIRRINTELAKLKEHATFIFELQGPVPVISNLYNGEEKKEKINVRPGQLIKITNKNKPLKNADCIVVDKKIYEKIKKGDSILFDSSLILNVISQEDCTYDNENKDKLGSRKEILVVDRSKEKQVAFNRSIKKEEPKQVSSRKNSSNIQLTEKEIKEFKAEKQEEIEDKIKKEPMTECRRKVMSHNSSDNVTKSNPIPQKKTYNLNERREMLKMERKKSTSKEKSSLIPHPELLIDFNQGDILKTKQRKLQNQYREIIKGKPFALSQIVEEDPYFYNIKPYNEENSPNAFVLDEDMNNPQSSQLSFRCTKIPPSKASKSLKEFEEEDANSILKYKSSYSLKERQNLISMGYRFTPKFNSDNKIFKRNNSPKKVLVCEVETQGEIQLLSEALVVGEESNYFLGSTLGPKDITDISRCIQLNITIISAIANKASDIAEIRKIINEEPFNGNEDNEENSDYRSFVGNRIKIFAKILTNIAIMNFDEILAEADGIILDPGVLSNNIGYDDLCLIEIYITEKCKITNKPIYIKTNCFNTLYSINIPSIADISNLDSSINSGIDGFILNEYFCSEAFIKMQKIVMEIESLVDGRSKYEEVSKSMKCNMDEVTKSYNSLKTLTAFYLIETLFDSAVKITYEVQITLIFLFCDSYLTAKRLSRYRPNCRIISPTNNKNEYNFMRVFRGVSGFYTKASNVTCYNESLVNE